MRSSTSTFARLLENVSTVEKVGDTFMVTTATGKCLEARAVVLATGADAVRLRVPGADRFWQRGVAYSTVSYAPLYIDKVVALIGSGSMAIRGALPS
jgi:thioredoxin reductase